MSLLRQDLSMVIGLSPRVFVALGFGYICAPILHADPEPPDLPEREEAGLSGLEFEEDLNNPLPEWDPAADFLSEEEGEQVYERLGHVIDPILTAIMYELELRDYQVEPLRQELTTFLVGRFLLLNLRRIEVQKAGGNQAKRRRAFEEVNDKLISLHSRTRKSVRKILERKQFRQYNRVINEMASPPRPSIKIERPELDN